jgi:hypothetical protein
MRSSIKEHQSQPMALYRFQSNRAGNWNIWRMDSDGGNGSN